MATVSDLIAASLKRLRVLQAGEVPTADDQADAFLRLNAMVSSWALQRLTIYQIVRTTWTIVASQASYTVGSGGQVNIARPTAPSAIDGITFQDTSVSPTFEYPAVSPMTEAQYRAVPQKAYTSPYPQGWYYAATYPTGTLYPFPIPTSSTLQGVIYVPTAVPAFTALSDTITLPPGYELALQENLAVLLAPEWGVRTDPALVQSAREAKAWLAVPALRAMDLDTSYVASLFGGGYGPTNVYTGS